MKTLSKREQENIASKILAFQINQRQLPLTKSKYNGLVNALSKETSTPAKKVKTFLSPMVWVPESV